MRKFLTSCMFFILAVVSLALAQTRTQPTAFSPAKASTLFWYRLDYLPDSANPTKRTEYLRLYSSRTLSQFVSNGTFLFDSLEATVSAPDAEFDANEYARKITSIVQNTPTNFRFKIYKDFLHSQYFQYERVWSTLYSYAEPLAQKWQLKNDYSKIAGYNCQRAVTTLGGRTYDAWFTREIPISDGPYKFSGLPGLIIKISDSRGNYAFELIKVKTLKNDFTIAPPTQSAKLASKTSLWKAREDLKANMPNLISAGASAVTADDKLRMRNKAKRDNNSIELQ